MTRAFALGLYSYTAPNPGTEGFGRFYQSVLATFKRLGIVPTYFAAEGPGFKGDLVKFGGQAHSRAIASGFAGVRTLSVVSNPGSSAEPGYDSFASASLAFVEESNESLLSFAVDPDHVAAGHGAEQVSLSFVDLQAWDFGFGLWEQTVRKAEFYVLGLDDGKLSREQSRQLAVWYNAPPAERLSKLRDVHPMNIVSDKQLAAMIGGESLRAFIERNGNSSLTKSGHGLWNWTVPEERLAETRNALSQSDLLIQR